MSLGEIEGVGVFDVVRLDLGTLTIPVGTPMAGAILPVLGYVVKHPEGVLLFDTGFGAEYPEFDRVLRPTRRSLEAALDAASVRIADVRAVVNCHVHYDHSGGNPLFEGVPTFVQRRDYEAMRELSWVILERLAYPGADLRILDGESQILPGIRVIPTPGHTPGHQSIVIEDSGGPIVLAGQAAYTAAEFENPQTEPARGLKTASDQGDFLASIALIRALRPRRVYFAHDTNVWEPRVR